MSTTTIPNTEYLLQRMNDLGLTEEQYTFERTWISRGDVKEGDKIITKEQEQKRSYKIFDADEEGNIIVRYFNLEGQPYRWKKDDTRQSRDFVRKRLREPKGTMKYYQEPGSPTVPFFTPGILRKYKAAKAGNMEEGKIHALYLTEGEFKAFKGYTLDIDFVGLAGIHGFYNGDVKGKMHEDIQELIITCMVDKIILLMDADLLTVKWETDKDLYKRPSNFYGSIKAFRESLQLLIDEDNDKVPLSQVYFMHLETKLLKDSIKGLDDLLCTYSAKVPDIIEDLASLNFAKKYFFGLSILDQNKDVHGRLFRYLGLTDEAEFYKTYQEYIGPREFKFKRKRYQYDQEKKEVAFVRHEDADKFMRIGPDWVKVITKLNKYGEPEEEIVPWKKSEITSDYKKFPDFLEQCQRFDDFCNEPVWNQGYKRVVNGCFNVCTPIRWDPKEGSLVNTVKLLKHIFQGKGNIILDDAGLPISSDDVIGDPFTVALDYLTIMYSHPKQMLPVPVLVSPENGTGKSTFLKWLQAIYGSSNMAILGNEQFKMKFNGHYITKFIIAIDEGFLDVDKKSEKERLKQLVTADSAFLEHKGMNVRRINYYGKVIISSNDADRVMKIDEGESRWFVVRVPVVSGEKDPDIEMKLKAEIPAFLHFIKNRQIAHPREDRLWFKESHFITDQFRVIVETTKHRVDRIFEEWIKEQFMTFRLSTLSYGMKNLQEIFSDPKRSKYRLDGLDIKEYLKRKNMKVLERPAGIHIPLAIRSVDELYLLNPSDFTSWKKNQLIVFQSDNQRPYVFKAEDWLSPEELADFYRTDLAVIVRDLIMNRDRSMEGLAYRENETSPKFVKIPAATDTPKLAEIEDCIGETTDDLPF